MSNSIFTEDIVSSKPQKIYGRVPVSEFAAKIEADSKLCEGKKAISFSDEINNRIETDFEKVGVDQMCHVSTFIVKNEKIYVSYYANTSSGAEDPRFQVARLCYCSLDNLEDKTIIDIQGIGEELSGRKVVGVYDTIIMERKDEPDNIYVLWTANIDGRYYRLYRVFNTVTETLGEIGVNRFKVGEITNDFCFSGMQNALKENGLGYKEFFADIGIMQKMSSREENGETYYYSGAYSGNFTCIIKSKDLITWEYVAQPNEGANGTGFENETKWENAVYVLDDKIYYFVRQWDPVYDDDKNLKEGTPYGILTYYDLKTGEWAKPVLVGDCQSRSDFIVYNGGLYLFYAPIDRNHLGILKIDTEMLSNSEVVLQSDIKSSCFYPFINYYKDGELAVTYTVDRKHIRMSRFTLKDYI